ncbi:noncanonical pyrimidine nucleotidase, YjjG family [Vagococcus coleopterorum]|uniref:Noncanonical pyrimidine nucleotidase, YjjG family n=1 Tax=Vagococcus coleopterorum TaxID=2714946 RepID=A0A6G8AL43_9ENTE|nr:YjjG family noncanonical pyrimidine nucleotidase [Vagococcus coleopterorum]QIL45778.1 noncanonical pyrimidine nucleotidase, YjjG family [Vagococcus coleopterorum]
MYKAILFDVDDTLLDFKKGQHHALEKLFADQGVVFTSELKEVYQEKNHQLWSALEAGKISRNDVLGGRFESIFDYLGMKKDGLEMDQLFRQYLNQEAEYLPGAEKVLATLQDKYELYIVTNGVADTQKSRLTKAGMYPYVKDVFISEETGYQKPMTEFFDYVFDRVPHVKPSECLIVGDSLSADIKGGLLYGIDTCWLNPDQKVNTLSQEPTYQIRDISEVLTILDK